MESERQNKALDSKPEKLKRAVYASIEFEVINIYFSQATYFI